MCQFGALKRVQPNRSWVQGTHEPGQFDTLDLHAPQMGTDFIAIAFPSNEKTEIARIDSAMPNTKTPRHQAGSAGEPGHNWGEVSRVPRRPPARASKMRRTASYVAFAKHRQEGCIGDRTPPPTVAGYTTVAAMNLLFYLIAFAALIPCFEMGR